MSASHLEEMTLETALDQIAEADYDLPRDALLWLRWHWSEVSPALVQMLKGFVAGTDRTDRTSLTLPYTTLLMAEMRETEAFIPLCELARLDSDFVDFTMGDDWNTGTLAPLLSSTFNGDVVPLKALAEDKATNEFSAAAGLQVLAYLAVYGRTDRDDCERYLEQLFTSLQTRKNSFLWTAWAEAVAWLGLESLRDTVLLAYDRQYLTDFFMLREEFEKDLELGKSLNGAALPERDLIHFVPIDDAIATLSTWYEFSEARKKNDKAARMRNVLAENKQPVPPPSPDSKIGRNEPCPCGSGKKHKKCCLNA